MGNLGVHEMETNVLSYMKNHPPNVYTRTTLSSLDGKTQKYLIENLCMSLPCCQYQAENIALWSHCDGQIEKK